MKIDTQTLQVEIAIAPADWRKRGRRSTSGSKVPDPPRIPAPELASALGRWYQPWSLDLLRDTPFNCILVTWADDNATALERDQQRIVREYAGLAHQRGIAVMAVVPSAAALSRTAAAAADSGLDGLVLDGEFAGGGKLVADIHRVTASRGHELPIIILPKAATAPGIRLFSEGGAVQATPTSEPWIDSNLWLAGLLKERDADAAWLGHSRMGLTLAFAASMFGCLEV